MANPHKGDVTVKAGDKEYTLRLDFNASCELEAATGKSSFALAKAMEEPTASLVRAMLWACLRRHHRNLSLDEVGDIISDIGPDVAADWLKQAGEASSSKADANPQRPVSL